jgi:hypothetical protein
MSDPVISTATVTAIKTDVAAVKSDVSKFKVWLAKFAPIGVFGIGVGAGFILSKLI